MERDCLRHTHTKDTHNPNTRDRTGGDASASLLLRASSDAIRHATTSSDFVLQWGNRKRLRCMKIQVKDKGKDDSDAPVTRTTVRVDRRVVRPDKDPANQPSTAGNSNQTNGYLNLRQRPLSPQQPPLQRVLRFTTCTSHVSLSNLYLYIYCFHGTSFRSCISLTCSFVVLWGNYGGVLSFNLVAGGPGARVLSFLVILGIVAYGYLYSFGAVFMYSLISPSDTLVIIMRSGDFIFRIA